MNYNLTIASIPAVVIILVMTVVQSIIISSPHANQDVTFNPANKNAPTITLGAASR